MRREARLNNFSSQASYPRISAFLVTFHERRETGDISRQNRRQTPFNPFSGQKKLLKPRIPPCSIKACSAVVGLGPMSEVGSFGDIAPRSLHFCFAIESRRFARS
jgi:hypothetical protein